MVGRAASLIKDSGGPLHIDSNHFHHMLLRKKFKAEAKTLREQIALLTRTLASTFADPHSFDLLTTCWLIFQNKNLRVRHIGAGEIFRWVIGKTINWVLKERTRGCHITSDCNWLKSWWQSSYPRNVNHLWRPVNWSCHTSRHKQCF